MGCHPINLTIIKSSSTVTATQLIIQLEKLYTPHLDQINKLIAVHDPKREGVSWPFLMHVHDEYVNAPKKLMFVGMETHGWNDEAETWPTYSEVAALYRSFMEKENVSSPFWWFIRDLSQSQQVDEYKKAVLWTNLSKISKNNTRPEGDLYNNTMPLFLDLLVEEISVVQPAILVIMTTSVHYQWHLHRRFGASESSKRIPLIGKRLFKLSSPELPSNTFQLCHPNRLRFTEGGYSLNADEIIQAIGANLD